MTLSPHDRKLWLDLVGKALDPKLRDISVIHKAAQRVNGSRKKRSAGAAMPCGQNHQDSAFFKLARLGIALRGDDAIARQLLRDYAHAVAAHLNGRPDPTASAPSPAPSPAPEPPSRWQDRKDING